MIHLHFERALFQVPLCIKPNDDTCSIALHWSVCCGKISFSFKVFLICDLCMKIKGDPCAIMLHCPSAMKISAFLLFVTICMYDYV